ncbi:MULTISPECIES: alpha/beta fold hydrolase [unclassified Exiguobacterium]|uniref:alpha/beta fold hydrolase n=1 Tax=unclassified Exiguobacterium TaxID=2644629 RepID=UPI001BEB2392|nr:MULTISPECIES: alpha/beta hydrolase [unclassified Exiguobacterium]
MERMIQQQEKQVTYYDDGSTGRPLLVLPSLGGTYQDWADILTKLTPDYRVVSFHPHEWSEDYIDGTTGILRQIDQFLNATNIATPVTLVGHSYGGLVAQAFALHHPERVAGLVLVDATSVDLAELDQLDTPMLDREGDDAVWIDRFEELSKATDLRDRFPEGDDRTDWNPAYYRAMHAIISRWKPDAKDLQPRMRDLGVPLTVLGRDKAQSIETMSAADFPKDELERMEEKWQELIQRQAKLSDQANVTFVPGTSHLMHRDRPDVIVNAILTLHQSKEFNL